MRQATATTSADDGRVRITTWVFGVGEATGPHRHEHDYVVVPVTGGTFRVEALDGSVREMTQAAGSAYLGTAGTAHDVISTSDRPVVFVEVELLG